MNWSLPPQQKRGTVSNEYDAALRIELLRSALGQPLNLKIYPKKLMFDIRL